MRMAQRVANLPPYLFVEINKKIAAKRAQGIDIVSFGIGDPDLPTPPHIIDKLVQASHDPVNHRYPETEGLPELRQAIAQWYKTRFNVTLDPTKEVLPLIGSKEGIAHVALCFIDPGDVALITDPGYPVYTVSVMFAGGTSWLMPIGENNNYEPDLEAIPSDVLKKAKILWINYPNNPTGAVCSPEFYARAVAFARKNNIAVLHDGPYSEVAFDGYKPASFLQTPGAKEVGIEFHSLSKSYNMTGWRIGMAVGNAEMINALLRVKSNLDSGIPQAIQQMAIAALNGPQDVIDDHNRIYQRRRDKVVSTLNKIGLKCQPPKASLYVWAHVPPGYTSAGLAAELIDKVGVVVTPGTGYGKNGEGYVRLSLTLPDEQVEKGIARLQEWRKNAD